MTSYAQGIADERERCARVALGPGDLGDEEAYYGRVIAEAIRNTGHAWDSRHGIPTLEAAATPLAPSRAQIAEALDDLESYHNRESIGFEKVQVLRAALAAVPLPPTPCK